MTLTPGKHTLQLILGDKDHIPHNPPVMSERITVNVVDAAQGAPAATRRPSPAEASVYFINVQNGSRIPPRTVIRFGLNNMGIAPAGVEKSNTGHHHLLIDTPLPPLDRPLPNDFNHLHFGAGQTEARVALNPGAHTLQLLFADENHVPHDPPVMSKPIKVTVAVPSAKKKKKKRRPRYRSSTQGLSAMTAVLELAPFHLARHHRQTGAMPSTAERKLGTHFSLAGERFCFHGPAEGLGHGLVEIGDELLDLGAQRFLAGEIAATEELSRQDREPDLDLIEP